MRLRALRHEEPEVFAKLIAVIDLSASADGPPLAWILTGIAVVLLGIAAAELLARP